MTFKLSFLKIGQLLQKLTLEQLMAARTRRLQNSIVSFLGMNVHYKQSVGE
jgi:hypothetical protein